MGQQGRADVKLDGPHEQVTQLLPEATRPHRAGAARWPDRSGALILMPTQQLAEHDILLRSRQQPRGRRATRGRRRREDPEAQ